jgi:hypothetical protein
MEPTYHSIIGRIEFFEDRAIVHSIFKIIDGTKEYVENTSKEYLNQYGYDYLIPMIYKGAIFYDALIDRTIFGNEDYYGHGGFKRTV